jgi:NitT/TauT family transport system ATP-binding protein
MAADLLRVRDVTLEYERAEGAFIAVDGVSLAVREGERFVLFGPSGCGKSTLLQAMAGFLLPARGTIELDGRPVRGPGPDRAVVFQEFDQLLPWRTVLGNVAYPLRVARRMRDGEAEAEALRFVRLVGLEAFAGAHPHQLSGGMKQRVAIARALAMSPRMLLMDEPFASLDSITRHKLQDDLLALLLQARITLLFVTHSVEEAVLLGDRILVLTSSPGRVRGVIENTATGTRHTAASAQVRRAVEELLAG